ncbi:Glutamate Aspartate transport system permease protein GltK [Liberibacter crescens BT-1]|uniref:Glutamate Aspartate transport system permease protein GltK n=1 Tax=Liberibacter crescens (strain BT-1) TaxID=1215343 RepID=L0EV90_LIBCB|nr:amino acid ABC transporter permease [Liberibacter crescens]AGA64877.1 Glutamate Aspartate transport system permease protein GltK [Liberibacter crescens BT-1]AMC12917.1 amino acid ABC transporter permease [Liberibacter crescens]
MTSSYPFIRKELLPEAVAPKNHRGVLGWIRLSFFSTPKDSLLTILSLIILYFILPEIIHWLFIDAVWTGTDRSVCATTIQGGIQKENWSGACWAFISDRYQQFMFGRYPVEERWRPLVVAGLFILLTTPLLIPSVPHKIFNGFLLISVFPIISFFLLYGGFYLSIVETQLWGGLMVTLIISCFGIVFSLPIGILLALGRISKMPVIRMLCITFIELIRGIPLVTVLFMASVMLPLFLPQGWTVDKLLRALIGVCMFASAYIAEVIRGGLQSIPKGQYEAADSIGLSYFNKMRFVIMPQAIRCVIPGIVNTFIGLFKDSSLVSIISMFDLLGIVRINFSDPKWATPVTSTTGLIFAGFIFWIFCFSMSVYSNFIEKCLNTTRK